MSNLDLEYLFEEQDEYEKYQRNKWRKPRAKINLVLGGSCDQCGRRMGQDLYCHSCCEES